MLPDYRTHTQSNIANLLKKSRKFSMEYFTILRSEDLDCSENKNSNSFKSMIMLYKTNPDSESAIRMFRRTKIPTSKAWYSCLALALNLRKL
jgi:hypothetical protein